MSCKILEMDKVDSNGASLEIIQKTNLDQVGSGASSAVTTLSSARLSSTAGNLLSNVAPPSSIPDFTLWNSSTSPGPKSESIENSEPAIQIIHAMSDTNTMVTDAPILVNQFPTTKFSAAIPPNKGIPQEPPGVARLEPTPEAEAVAPSGILGLVKGALSSQVMTKMYEKAKSSAESIITTLDPQMSEYIYSSGDLEFTVTSEEEDIVSGIREAAHMVFGKAWVNGIKLGPSPHKLQAVGFENAIKRASERIEYSRKFRDTVTIAIENVLLKQDNYWFDFSVLLLKDVGKNITIHTFSQGLPVPVNKFLDKKVADIDVENKLSEYLMGVPCWQEEVSGITRKEILSLAARALFKLYKDHISQMKV